MTSPGHDQDDALLSEIYDFLEEGEPERALASARIALKREGDDPVLRFLAGQALLDLDQPEEAAAELARAVELDPEDPEFRAKHAYALFKGCRFQEAAEQSRLAMEADPRCPDALDVRGLLLERQGEFDAADELFRKASRLDPERFPTLHRLERDAFDEVLTGALDELRRQPAFGAHVDEVPVTVDEVPSEEILFDGQPPLDPELLGLFVGTARDEMSWQGPMVGEPPRILVFRRNLERYGLNREQLHDEIVRTLRHEFAHYLGFEEEDMPGMDLD